MESFASPLNDESVMLVRLALKLIPPGQNYNVSSQISHPIE